ncbi:MAG: MATE family efflux transporter [Treponema sp.]|nr:MATE family efflux transporter [Treponema sp.]
MTIQLSDHFTYRRLLRFTLPSIIMMIFTSVYSVVDGIFVSNFVGKTSFAAINLVMPPLMLFGSLGFMVGTGGSAFVAVLLGEKNNARANSVFSLLVYVTAALGTVMCIAAFLLMGKIVLLLGAQGQLLHDATLYARILLCAGVAFILQNAFQAFLIAAEKTTMGLTLTVAAGCTNIALDALFIIVFKWGLVGAAAATVISQLVGGIIPLVYFLLPNKSLLRLGKTTFDMRALVKTATNGASELLSNIAMSSVSILYNFQLITIAGENGIASYGALMYVSFIFAAVFLGYGIGSAPIVSYHYGAQNTAELRGLFKKDLVIVSAFSVVLAAAAWLLATPLAKLFAHYDAELFAMIRRAFTLYSFTYLLMGFNIIGSSFFTALNDGLVSALISFLRTLVFQVAAVLILPRFLQVDGIWLSGGAAEIASCVVVFACVVACRKKYGYW